MSKPQETPYGSEKECIIDFLKYLTNQLTYYKEELDAVIHPDCYIVVVHNIKMNMPKVVFRIQDWVDYYECIITNPEIKNLVNEFKDLSHTIHTNFTQKY
ncbi:8525_t:CDS:1, partial [Gigaspora margarita]